MSHKIAKAKRKLAKRLITGLEKMPFSKTEEKYTGALQKASATKLNDIARKIGYDPIPTERLTKDCQKYWFKRL